MTEKIKEIIIPKWLSKKKDGLGPRIKKWNKVKKTKKAICIRVTSPGPGRGDDVWLPKSQVEYNEYETNTFDDYEDEKEDNEDVELVHPGIEMVEDGEDEKSELVEATDVENEDYEGRPEEVIL